MKKSTVIPIIALILLTTQSMLAQAESAIIFHKPKNPARASAPFSEAVQAGNLFFLAGQIGMNRETNVLPETIQGQTEQTIKNIQGVLEHHDMTLDNVVKCTVILSDIEDFKAFNSVYTQYFTKKPARTTFAAKDLAIGAKIEIDVIAIKTSERN